MLARYRVPMLAAALVAALLIVPLQGSADVVDNLPRVYVVVIDGLEPGDVGAELTPNLAALIDDEQARVYTDAQAAMISETNANHAAMVTGAWGETSGIFANQFFDRTRATPARVPLDRPELLLAETVFDSIRGQSSDLTTGAVMGKSKLRNLFGPIDPTTANPEGIEVAHGGPDHLWGASESPDPQALLEGRDIPAESGTGSGYAHDTQTMDSTLTMIQAHDPHFVFVNLSNVDGFQHLHGVRSPQGRAAVVNADLQLGRLVATLKNTGAWERSTLVVTADHSFQDTGDPVGTSSLPGAPPGPEVDLSNQVTPQLTGTVIALNELLGSCPETSFAAVSHGGSASVYVTDEDFDGYAAASVTGTRAACLVELRGRALARVGVSDAYFRLPTDGAGPEEMLVTQGWNLQTPRAGELILTADDRHAFMESRTSSANLIPVVHGGPTARPIPFVVASGGQGLVVGIDSTSTAYPVDIASTVTWLLGLQNPPAQAQGRVLCEAFSTCV